MFIIPCIFFGLDSFPSLERIQPKIIFKNTMNARLSGFKLMPYSLLKCVFLCSLSIHNLIISLKHRLNNSSSLDYIFKLKALFGYDYIQGSCFPSQQVGHKVYLFKMSIDGVAFEFNLV